jgi:hypothetical protein
MSTTELKSQRGQATTEFAIAMAVVAPLVMGVIYIGKYQDVKYSAIQASRYAAFERAFDPSATHKNSTQLAEETRARFFADPLASNQGAVALRDTSQGRSLNRNWYGTGLEPLIKDYSNIAVDVTNSGTPTDVSNKLLDGDAKINFNIDDPGIQQAHVTVPLVSAAYFDELAKLSLGADASTFTLVDGYNADGNGTANNPAARTVRARVAFDWGLILGKIPGLTSVLQTLDSSVLSVGWQALSDTPGPQWACVSPDVVPTNAVSSTVQYDPTQVCN